MLKDSQTCRNWSAGQGLVGDNTRNGKTVAMVAEVTIKISRQEVVPRSQALWDRGFTEQCNLICDCGIDAMG